MSEDQNSHICAASGASGIEPTRQPATSVQITRGTCCILFAYDIGLAIDLDDAERRITTTTHRETIRHKRRTPDYFNYARPPLRVRQSIEPLAVSSFRTSGDIDAIIYDFGAVSLTYRIPLNGSIGDLLSLSDALYDNTELLADGRRQIEQLLNVIRPAVNKPTVSNLVEDYVIYQIEAMEPVMTRDTFLSGNRRLIAQILRAERSPLSEQQINDALACQLRYADNDMLIIDWNATLLLDTEADDIRAVLEYANVELLEMRHLDDSLDNALEESYSLAGRRKWTRRLLLTSQTRELQRIAELQVDGALMFEGVNNAIKLLGDQYLARVYRAASDRLHVNDWDASIIRKLQALESIYEKMSDHAAHWRMELLEWIIIVLIAISIGVSFIPGLIAH